MQVGRRRACEKSAAQREMLTRLRAQGVIGDDILRLIETELDHDEIRLT